MKLGKCFGNKSSKIGRVRVVNKNKIMRDNVLYLPCKVLGSEVLLLSSSKYLAVLDFPLCLAKSKTV